MVFEYASFFSVKYLNYRPSGKLSPHHHSRKPNLISSPAITCSMPPTIEEGCAARPSGRSSACVRSMKCAGAPAVTGVSFDSDRGPFRPSRPSPARRRTERRGERRNDAVKTKGPHYRQIISRFQSGPQDATDLRASRPPSSPSACLSCLSFIPLSSSI